MLVFAMSTVGALAAALAVVAQAAVPLPARLAVAPASVEALARVQGQAPLLSRQGQVRCRMRA